MDSNTLERLVMDRTLGELQPDVVALLDAYLADRPVERQATEPISRTVVHARAALADTKLLPVKPLPVQTITHRLRMEQRWAFASRITSLAACLLVGMGIHAAWIGTSSAPTKGAGQLGPGPVVETGKPTTAQLATSSHDVGFWSIKRVYDRAGQRKTETGRRVIWDSPLSTPRLGDST